MNDITDNLLDTIPAIMLNIDEAGNVIDYRASQFSAGHPEPETLPCPLNKLLSEHKAEELIQISKSLRPGQTPAPFHYSATVNSEKLYFEGRISKKVAGLTTLIAWDDSESKRAEEDKHNLYEQLRQSQKMEALGQLTGGIAHDFNNILASILGYADLTLDAVDEMGHTDLVRYLQEVIDSGEKARDLIAQMLAFARAKPNDAISLMPTPLVKETVKMLQSALPSTIELNITSEEDLPHIEVDPSQFHQLIVNLCINARDAIEEKGNIDITITHGEHFQNNCASCQSRFEGSYVEIAISDNGHGINPTFIDKIFEPFFTTKESNNNTGMGLSVVHGIVHENGGHIVVDSQPNYGTTIKIYLPAVEQQKDEVVKGGKAVSLKDIDINANILVVDDEESVARLQGELLRAKGFSAVVFSDSLHALEAFNVNPDRFDLLLADQTMPGLTGIELAREVLSLRPDMPIVLNSAQGDHDYTDEAKSAGIKAFLTKPIPSETLINTIIGLLANKK